MLQSKLPIKYWGEALLTATYLINHMPTVILDNMTPFEILYKEKPHYAHLRILVACAMLPLSREIGTSFSPRLGPVFS